MRTTIDLAEDAYHVAKAHASDRKLSLGKAISELILHSSVAFAAPSMASAEIREQVAKYPSVLVDQVLTVERVKRLLDDE